MLVYNFFHGGKFSTLLIVKNLAAYLFGVLLSKASKLLIYGGTLTIATSSGLSSILLGKSLRKYVRHGILGNFFSNSEIVIGL